MDKPLDIRIVQLVDALNQIGIDPTSVKQLIEELLCGVDDLPETHESNPNTGELDEEPCDFLEEASGAEDEQFYLGNRVWFWDPIGKRIIRGNIHRLDINLPGESVLVQQFEGLHPRWVSCQVEELHRDTGRITTENIGNLVLNPTGCPGALVGYLKAPKGSRMAPQGSQAIIVEDDRHHPDWECDKYILHFVSHGECYQDSYSLD